MYPWGYVDHCLGADVLMEIPVSWLNVLLLVSGFSLTGYIALPQAALGGPVRKKDIFLEHGPLITSHSGHAVMSDSTLKPCKGVKPPPGSLGVQGRCGHFESFGGEVGLEGRVCISDP